MQDIVSKYQVKSSNQADMLFFGDRDGEEYFA